MNESSQNEWCNPSVETQQLIDSRGSVELRMQSKHQAAGLEFAH